MNEEREVIKGMFEAVGMRMEKVMEKKKGGGSEVGAEKEEEKGKTRSIGKGISLGANTKEQNESKHEEDDEPWSIAKLYFLDPSKWATDSTATNLTPHEAAYTLGAFIEASMAGTPAALKLFFQAMLWYPEWQERIYDEICEVCGRTSGDAVKQDAESQPGTHQAKSGAETKPAPRMPQLSDMPRLPVIRAVIKEMLRWRPTLPGGFPHRLMRDDLYTPSSSSSSPSPSPSPPPQQPFLLKKDSLLLWHHYTMSRSTDTYPGTNPESFNPSRFLDPTTYPHSARLPLTQFPTCQFDAAFGFGRRMCPGTRIAEEMMVMMVGWVVAVGGWRGN